MNDSLYIPDEHGEQYAIPKDLADAMFRNGMTDTSWHNDICASFSLEESDQVLRIWVEAINPEDRESASKARFWVAQYSPDYEWIKDINSTDSLTEALGTIIRCRSYK